MKLVLSMSKLSLDVAYLTKAGQSGLKLSTSEAAALFVDEAKALVPVDTGNLQNHIHAEEVENTGSRYLMNVQPFNEAANDYGFDPAYARRIEFGFMGVDRLGRQFHQAAQPYMRPAWDMHQAEAAEIIREGVYDALDAAMSSVAAKRR